MQLIVLAKIRAQVVFPTPLGPQKIGMRQFSGGNGILQGSGQCTLAYHRLKGRGTIFPCRYDIVFHIWDILCFLCKMYTKKKSFGYSSYLCDVKLYDGQFSIMNDKLLNSR